MSRFLVGSTVVGIVTASAAVLLPTALVAEGLPNGASTVDATPMRGPFATLDAVCTASGRDVKDCQTPPKACGAPTLGKTAAIMESRVLPGCEVALRTAKGWFVVSTEGMPAWAGYLNNGDRYQSTIASIAPSSDGTSVLVRGTFIHDTNAMKMPWLDKAPADKDWFECEERLFVCSVGAAGPSCAGPFSVSFTAYCRDGEHVERALGKPEPHDFAFTPAVAGTALTMTAKSPKQPRTAPLPGWAVTALDAPNTVKMTRPLAPEKVTLQFP